jgi:hypothetical protein
VRQTEVRFKSTPTKASPVSQSQNFLMIGFFFWRRLPSIPHYTHQIPPSRLLANTVANKNPRRRHNPHGKAALELKTASQTSNAGLERTKQRTLGIFLSQARAIGLLGLATSDHVILFTLSLASWKSAPDKNSWMLLLPDSVALSFELCYGWHCWGWSCC